MAKIFFKPKSTEIEDKTANTGSFIDFDTYTELLHSAFLKDNESIVGNIITSTELKAIKSRGKAGSTASPMSLEGQAEKRYVIVSVIGGKKPVHYSLTLEPEDSEEANVANLRQVIVRLRGKLSAQEKEKRELLEEHAALQTQVDMFKRKTEGSAARKIVELRGQLAKAQQELHKERQNHEFSATSHRGWGQSNNLNNFYRCHSAERAKSHSPATGRDVRDNFGLSRGDWRKTPDRTMVSHPGPRSASPNLTRPNYATPRSREVSPSLRARGGTPTNTHNTFSNVSPARRGSPAAVSTSLGGRFDPTAYQREKLNREHAAKHGKAWGAGATSSPAGSRYRYSSPSQGESGYISANSQVHFCNHIFDLS